MSGLDVGQQRLLWSVGGGEGLTDSSDLYHTQVVKTLSALSRTPIALRKGIT